MLNISIKEKLNSPNRFIGGSDGVNDAHPFIKGYFYTFVQFPRIITNNYPSIKSNGSNTIMSLCEGFTPPGDRQIITEDIQGLNGLDASFVVKQQIDRQFSLMYRDLWGSPIFKIHRAWTSIIDPYWGGIVNSSENAKLEYIPKDYKGKILVIETKPLAIYADQYTATITEDDIQKVFLFDGVVPLTDLMSVYDSNITDNTFVKPNIQYKFDGTPIDETFNESVISQAVTILKTIKNNGKTVDGTFSPSS